MTDLGGEMKGAKEAELRKETSSSRRDNQRHGFERCGQGKGMILLKEMCRY